MTDFTPFQEYIHQSKYARWRDDLGRRENWGETVDRTIQQLDRQFQKKTGVSFPASELAELREGIFNHDVLPSMRLLMTSGKALERDNVAGYNCAYLALNRLEAFPEMMYILCCGTGVGFSVEREEVSKLREISSKFREIDYTIIVGDSKIGWADAYKELLEHLWFGMIPKWDTSLVRPEGSVLKTFGGRASGPGPLEELFRYTVAVFKEAAGRKLTSEEVHGIACMIGSIVVSGGVRRSALLSLFNKDDQDMLHSKDGEYWEEPMRKHYRMANNSIAWNATPTKDEFQEKWSALTASGTGEPGIFNRQAARAKADRLGRDSSYSFGVNPCGEIVLRDRQFCNLSTAVVRPGDTEIDLMRKVRLATILGTIQASFTDFRYLSKEWKQNCEEEALLGVSLGGVQDNPLTSVLAEPDELRGLLRKLRQVYRSTNHQWSQLMGIAQAAAGTCNKPDGNGGQFVDMAPGVHARHGEYIIRTTRGSKHDPVSQVVYMSGVPTEDDITAPDRTHVFSWPQKAPEGAVTRHDITALRQLEHWMIFNEEWCEHNPSVTVNVKPHEWEETGEWVFENFDKMIGATFMPDSDHVYPQAPYQDITEEEYEKLVAEMPETINWDMLTELETHDRTEGARELACVSGACAI